MSPSGSLSTTRLSFDNRIGLGELSRGTIRISTFHNPAGSTLPLGTKLQRCRRDITMNAGRDTPHDAYMTGPAGASRSAQNWSLDPYPFSDRYMAQHNSTSETFVAHCFDRSRKVIVQHPTLHSSSTFITPGLSKFRSNTVGSSPSDIRPYEVSTEATPQPSPRTKLSSAIAMHSRPYPPHRADNSQQHSDDRHFPFQPVPVGPPGLDFDAVSSRTYWKILPQSGARCKPDTCNEHHLNIPIPNKNEYKPEKIAHAPRSWSSESDNLICRFAEEAKSSNTQIDWSTIAVALGRRRTQCQVRWTEVLDPAIKKGKWSVNEDEKLRVGYAELGKSWHKIATLVRSRTQRQCRSRWLQIRHRTSVSKHEKSPFAQVIIEAEVSSAR